MDLTITPEENVPLSPKLEPVSRIPSPSPHSSTDRPKTPPIPTKSQESIAFQKSFIRQYSSGILSRTTTAVSAKSKEVRKGCLNWRALVRRLITDWWLAELLAWSLSAICMLLIAVIFVIYDDRQLPSHWRFGISLNTEVAILSAIAKYSLSVPLEAALGQLRWAFIKNGKPRKLRDIERFDDATRGPLGAATLLIHMRARTFASLGAIIILLCLALDPFFQQLVSYPQRVGALGNSTLSRSIRFQTASTVQMQNGSSSMTADQVVYNAVNDALFGDGSQSQVRTFCPTSNCVWPPFQTIGLCSECHDISDLLQYSCQVDPGDWMPSRGRAYLGSNSSTSTNVTSCGYFLNATSDDPVLMSGYVLNSTTSPPSPGQTLWYRTIPLYWPLYYNKTYYDRSYYFRSTIDMLPLMNYMVAFHTNVSDIFAKMPPKAAECSLKWCVKTISAKYENGNYEETVVSEYKNNTARPDSVKAKWNPVTHLSVVDHSNNLLPNISITPPGQADIYGLTGEVFYQTTISLKIVIPSFGTTYNTTGAAFIQQENTDMSVSANPVVLPFNMSAWRNPSSASEYSDGLARAVTNVMRLHPYNAQPVKGYGGLETYIHISWAWFTMPLVVLSLTFVLLIVTIMRGPSRGEGGIWKTSCLALVLHGMGEGARQDFGDAWTLSGMREKAGEFKIVMKPELDGFRMHRDVVIDEGKK